MMPRVGRVDRIALALYVCVAISIGFMDHRSRRFPEHPVVKYIPGVLDGSYGAPAIYRPLSPLAVDGFTRLTGWPPLTAFLVFRLLVIFASLAAFHWYLRFWYSGTASLGGTLGMAALLPLTFTNSWAHPDSFPELVIMAIGCRLVAARCDGWLALVLVIGMLNRETASFLAVLWTIDRLRTARSAHNAAWAGTYAVLCLGVYFGLRLVRGYEGYQMFMLWQNLALLKPLPAGFDPYVRIVGYFWIALLAVPGALAIAAVRRPGTPRFFVSGVITSALMLVVAFAIAAIGESRVLLPILPMLAPAVVWAVQPLDTAVQSA
jgi:hypothetical protein